MNSIKLAVAAAAASAAAAAGASGLEIYGSIDEYVEVISTGSGSTTRLSSGGSSPSVLGFRGEEEISSGMKAFFGLEAGYLPDVGSSTPDGAPTAGSYLFQRHAFAGLKGSFGSASFGLQYLPTFISLASTDPAGFSLGSAIGPFAAPGAAGINGGLGADFATRSENSVSYTSPRIGRFVFMGFAGLGEDKKEDGSISSTRGNIYSASVRMVGGPFGFVLAGSAYKSAFRTPAGPVHNGVDYLANGAVWRDFGWIKPAATFAWKKGADTAFDSDVFAAQIGFSMPLGRGSFAATAAYLRNSSVEDADAASIGARYDHPLSSRTKVYAGFVVIDNDKHASYGPTGGGGSSASTPVEAGATASTVFAGVKHSF